MLLLALPVYVVLLLCELIRAYNEEEDEDEDEDDKEDEEDEEEVKEGEEDDDDTRLVCVGVLFSLSFSLCF